MNRIHDQKAINYSDHVGIYAEFSVSEQYDEIAKSLSLTPANLLKKVIETQQEGINSRQSGSFIFLP
ncbi:hypothetical protein WUBG_14234 [Wuchereria bancrofti]|uniref:Uncharacterized protein n=1 Tax=Wuchereria bancrofti TaxID=6293 RepID=J9ECU1_WUCBA|nr:hypothetical protein WUBG_14234 [Wuchereria bancrofti]